MPKATHENPNSPSARPPGSATDIHARARIIEREIERMTEAEKRVLGDQVAELMRFFNMLPNDQAQTPPT